MKYKLSISGGLGNQLFQWAQGKFLEKCGHEVFYDTSFFDCINGDESKGHGIPHRNFILQDLLKEKIKNNKNIQAHNISDYFQKDHNLEQIKDEVISSLNLEFKTEYDLKNSCALHVRRGDYKNIQHIFNLLNPAFFHKAIDIIKPTGYTYIFSDDIDWCKENLNIKKSIFIEGKPEIEDFLFMSKCSDNIISNSTFSWWSAWLNNNPSKKVVQPKKWFTRGNAGKLINPEWRSI